ncbi:MAG TPA: hypothetical protein VI322_04250 [Candidatus Saccharimonadia bacterium]
MSATSASAASQYRIDVPKACQEQGHSWAASYGTGPYNWYCVDFSVSIPGGVSLGYAGPVDMQGYCNRHYPGSRAVVLPNSIAIPKQNLSKSRI